LLKVKSNILIMDKIAEKTAEQQYQVQKFTLPLAPASFFAMTLGLAETGNAWRNATSLWNLPWYIGEILEALAVISFFWWILIFINKWIQHRKAAINEFHDPVQSSFLALIPESIILVALAIHPYTTTTAISLFWIGSVLNLIYGAYKLSTLWTQDRQQEQTTPSLFLTFTASILVNALVAGLLGYNHYGFLLLGIGTISWLIMDSVITQQLTVGGLGVKTRNFMGIYMAPAVILFVAYQVLSGETMNISIAYALMGYALFIFVTISFSLKWLKEQAFAPGYWAYTFGIATLSQGLSLFALKTDDSAVGIAAVIVFCLTNILVLAVVIGSVKLIIKGSYFPK
jgi:tellurite resistance protein